MDRLGRELRLTPAGQILYRYAVKLLQLREEARQALADYRGELAGRMVIGASTIPGSYLLPQIIGAFKGQTSDRADYPEDRQHCGGGGDGAQGRGRPGAGGVEAAGKAAGF